MRLPKNPSSSWLSSTGTPTRVFGTGSDDYELFEEDGEFVLSIEMPGFDVEDIKVGWDDGRLSVAASREDRGGEQQRTYRRTFRMPKRIAEDEIRARYKNGVLDVYLPTVEEPEVRGTEIPIETE